jgi:hypothetical protein
MFVYFLLTPTYPGGDAIHASVFRGSSTFMSNRSSFSMVRLLLAGFLLLATAFMPVSLQAQGTSATVSGVVTDSTGAKIPAATVTFTNASTGAVANATTNGEGLYRLNGLLPGLYNAAVTMQGFKTALQQSIDLHLEDQVSLDYVLEVGASSESVTINADANILETQSPTLSQVIEGRQVEDTPLNGRNTMNLVALTPGVVSQGGTSGAASNNTSGGAFTNANSFGNYSIAGGLAAQGTIYVDGAPINTVEGMAVAFVITQDAVQEFRVESSVVNPQYGGFGGGVVSFGTKSGGNRMHGTLYEYFRNTIFNANTLFNNLYNIQRPKFNQNQFGATIGGPILKDKAFYFASYEGYRLAQGVINSGRVPTPAELNGDFTADSKIINPVPTLGPMVAPGVYAYASYNQVQCGGVLNKFCIGAPVNPGDAVADPTSQYLANTLHYFPLPNATGHGAAVNFLQNGKANARTAQETMRVDYNLNPRNKLFARVTRFDRTQDPTQFFNNPIGPQSFTGVGATASQYVIGDTATLNPTSVFDVRLSYLRYFSYLQPANTSVPLGPLDNGDQAGFWSAAAHQISPYFPGIIITNNTTFPYTGLGQAAQQPLNLYTIFATYSKVLGRHSLAAGGEVRQGEEYFFNQPFLAGSFAFAGTQTACTPSGAGTVTFNDAAHTALNKYCGAPGGAPTNLVIPGSGATPVADFVSGQFAASPTGFTTTDHPSAVNHYAGVFANDTWSLSARLTVTAGLRYELPGSFFEKHDNNAVLLPQLANPLVLVNSAAYPGRGDLQAHHTLFSPRVGFSYAPYTGTTVRAGYSLAFLGQDTAFPASPVYSSINSPVTFVPPSYLLCAPLGLATAGTAAGNACNAPGSTAKASIIQPTGRAAYAANPALFNGQPLEGREPFGKFPYMQQWNANVQQAFGSSAVLQLAYLGARGAHMPITGTFNINQLPDTAAIGATSQANRPFPLYQNVSATAPYIGDTYYNSAQVTLTKRFKSGGTVLGNYSWSKFLGDSESSNPQVESHTQGVIQDYTNLRAERSYLSFDVPQRLVVSYILDLPVGHGKHFLGNASAPINAVVGGWNVSGINAFQSGFPLALIGSPTPLSAAFGGGTPRPNVIAGCNQKAAIGFVAAAQQQKTTFNTACFSSAAPAAGAAATAGSYLGNQPRTSGILRTQGVDNWDFSVGKTTTIHEDINLVIRAEAFNVTNRVQFGDPGLTFGSATFGVPITQANSPRSFQISLRANY